MRKFKFCFIDYATDRIEKVIEDISEIDAKDRANRILSDMQVTYRTWFYLGEIKNEN